MTWPVEPPAGTRVDDTLAWYAGQYKAAAAAVSRLEARVTELTRERDAQEKVLAACARLLGDSMPEWAPLPVREIGCEACAAAEARADAAEGRERELTQALERIAANAEDWHGPEGLESGHAKALAVVGGWAREALAGGGRTPPGQAMPECICPNENTRLGNCPRHSSSMRFGNQGLGGGAAAVPVVGLAVLPEETP